MDINELKEIVGLNLSEDYYDGYNCIISDVFKINDIDYYFIIEDGSDNEVYDFEEWDFNLLCISLVSYEDCDLINNYYL